MRGLAFDSWNAGIRGWILLCNRDSPVDSVDNSAEEARLAATEYSALELRHAGRQSFIDNIAKFRREEIAGRTWFGTLTHQRPSTASSALAVAFH